MKIAFTADLHFNCSRQQEALRIFDWIIQKSHEEHCDLMIIAGDIWEHWIPNTRESGFLEVIALMKKGADLMSVFILYGTPTHDVKGSLDVFRIIQAQNDIIVIENPNVIIDAKSELAMAWLPGLSKSWLLRNSIMSIAESNQVIHQELGKIMLGFNAQWHNLKIPKILIHHGQVTGCDVGHKTLYTGLQISKDELNMAGADAILLGDIHKAQQFEENIRYCGSPYYHDFGEAHDEKGFYILEWIGERFDWNWHKTPARPMIQIELEWQETGWQYLTNGHDPELLENAECRIRYTIPQERSSTITDQMVKDFVLNDTQPYSLKFDRRIISQAAIRSQAISQAHTLQEEFKAWADSREEKLTDSIKLKVEELES
jgi:DNA repair exonuclease SbcCD nuclease subunit